MPRHGSGRRLDGEPTCILKREKNLATKVTIDGLGRIERATLKLLLDTPGVELASVGDTGSYEGKNGKERSR